ncbi:hypothetical protein [Fictibacillus barbaricus]|uniref:Yip1 domain-containing protein n=1 Tax=Fictibacillus barbaricus TaxID=182136 RepID=A0ABS2ZFM5_9BACL|nr:hypothetical protein [Fictibacillus barbaricus]MBN3545411.1 hypothetical protein [Fictibacillus barbaricus]GGB59245.1 hypothetical protein GCM10007199_26370 [Fictibacillus barbaricus]
MTGRAQIIPALTKPYTYFSLYKEWKEKEGFWIRFLAILAVSGLLHALSFFAAFPSFKTLAFVEAAKLSGAEQDLLRYLLSLAGGVWGLIVPLVAIQSGTLFLYFFFRDIGYKALFYVMSFVYILFLLGLLFELPLQFATGAEEVVQPLGFGFAGVLFFKHGFWQELLNLINVFTIWGTVVVYFALRQLSYKEKKYCLIVTIGFSLFFNCIFSLYAALVSGQLV